ncbi:thioesterase thiol ester dehydrase-isomerase [Lentinula edodes]|nr:thioesterase thiol ester dehydrase-isomerase [Lentinula edodes]KAJ3919229.1 thioesterase thiol ester dehydrase-isomerase [Lentinula edodes]
MHSENLKTLRREEFGYTLSYRTRWSDNDQYHHINNSIYYHLFDSIVNTYLLESCGQNPQESHSIGLVVSSWCQFFAPLSFPDILDLCLRVKKLGDSSVTYEIGVFKQGSNSPTVVGGYIHVFVDRKSRKRTAIPLAVRNGLEALTSSASKL